MRFHGILLTRDDEDIIAQCIQHALTWCDALYVFDTGSGDSTTEIVEQAAREDRRVKIATGHPKPLVLCSGLRAVVFHKYRDSAERGDWFVQVDSDEFFHISPRTFVAEYLRPNETCVYNLTYEFRLTESEVQAWDKARETQADRARPISERRRYYNVLRWTEPRMFCYRPSMQWWPYFAYPYNAGFVARRRIPVRHYPHRDVLQLKKRWLLRKLMAPLTEGSWTHWRHSNWTKLVAEDGSSGLNYWQPGTELPVLDDQHHLPHQPKRGLQWMAHRFFLPVLDASRPRFPADHKFHVIPAEIEASIHRVMCELEGSGYSKDPP
jgi:glycosyltransferase involved in cell wall biosynthesis